MASAVLAMGAVAVPSAGAAVVGPGGLVVGVVPSVERPRAGALPGIHPGQVNLVAARGESEGAWLLLGARRYASFTTHVTHLTSSSGARIPGGNVDLRYARPVRVTNASAGGRAGAWLDPLIPWRGRTLRMRGGTRLAMFVDVAVPTNVRSGRYSGWVVFRGLDGKVDARVRISVLAHPVRMRARPYLQSSVGVDWRQITRFERPTTARQQRQQFIDAVSLLADNRVSSADSFAMIPGLVDGRDATTDRMLLEWMGRRGGITSLRVPMYPTWPWADPTGRDFQEAARYLRAAAYFYGARGWLHRTHVYAVDEPGPGDVYQLRRWDRLLRAAHPRLKLLVTASPNAAMRPYVEIWSANVSPGNFSLADARTARRWGDQYWMYLSVSSAPPYPTPVIDDVRPSWRALGWLAFRNGATGISYWDATRWSEVSNPYVDVATYRQGATVANGDGMLMYPGRPVGSREPVPSLRLLQMRDGIEDHELLMRTARCGYRRLASARARQLAGGITSFSPSAGRVSSVRASLLYAIRTAHAAGRRC